MPHSIPKKSIFLKVLLGLIVLLVMGWITLGLYLENTLLGFVLPGLIISSLFGYEITNQGPESIATLKEAAVGTVFIVVLLCVISYIANRIYKLLR